MSGNAGVKEGYGGPIRVVYGPEELGDNVGGELRSGGNEVKAVSRLSSQGITWRSAMKKENIALALSIAAFAFTLFFARRGPQGPAGPAGPMGPAGPAGVIPANKPIDVLPPVNSHKPFEITGPRFTDTPELKRWEEGGRWRFGDMTVEGTRGSDTLLVDLHVQENGRFVRYENCPLQIVEGNPADVIEGFKQDSLLRDLGNGRYRHLITGTEFKAVFSTNGARRMVGHV